MQKKETRGGLSERRKRQKETEERNKEGVGRRGGDD